MNTEIDVNAKIRSKMKDIDAVTRAAALEKASSDWYLNNGSEFPDSGELMTFYEQFKSNLCIVCFYVLSEPM